MAATILCGVDRSPHARAAARLAGALARRLGCDLELLHVLEPGMHSASEGQLAALRAVMQEDLDVSGVAVRLQTGSVPEVLGRAGRRAALLVVGTRGEGAVRQALLGSVAAALTRDPPCQVIVVPPAAAGSADAPLAGGSVVCGIHDERDRPPAHAAARMARDLGIGLTLAHVLAPPRVPVSAAGGASPASMLGPTEAEAQTAGHMLEATARSIAIDVPGEIACKVLAGPPGPQLDRLAVAERAVMLAVGASDRGPLAGALAGAPEGHLVRHGSRPVLVCPRPHGPAAFATPPERVSSIAS
jgi:nucleotide-binding universal stress UspA family protein